SWRCTLGTRSAGAVNRARYLVAQSEDSFSSDYSPLQPFAPGAECRPRSAGDPQCLRDFWLSGGTNKGGGHAQARVGRIFPKPRPGELKPGAAGRSPRQNFRAETVALGTTVPPAAKGAGGLGWIGREGLGRHPQVQGLSRAAAR